MQAQLLVNRLKFAATPTAPRCARVFVEHTLRAWLLPDGIVNDAKVIVSELVTNSVEATGFAHPKPTYADLQKLGATGGSGPRVGRVAVYRSLGHRKTLAMPAAQ